MKVRRLYVFGVILAGILVFGMEARLEATATTHIWAPSTDVQPFGKWHLTSDFYFPVEKDSVGSRPDTVTNLGLTVGVLPFQKFNMEVGFDHKTGYGGMITPFTSTPR